MIEQTAFEILSFSLKEFKQELFSFLNNVVQEKNRDVKLDKIQWIERNIPIINQHIAQFKMDFSIIGLHPDIYLSSQHSMSYPQVFLKKGVFTIEYSLGDLFHHYKIYTKTKDLLHIEPFLKVIHPSSSKEYLALAHILSLMCAELTQYQYDGYSDFRIDKKE